MHKLHSMIGGANTMRSTTLIVTVCSIVLGVALPTVAAVPVTESSEAILWEEWSGWSNCSRTCGAGITTQTRTCLTGDCSGESAVQYRSCCIEECPTNTPDFREEQCKERTLNIDLDVDWVPSKQEDGECQLICVPRVSHEAFAVPQGIITSYVENGTPCMTSGGGQGVCLGTLCAAVGCDNVLGSLKSLDKCHQCVSPDDSSCVEHSGMFMSNQPDTTGDVVVLNISSGARSILLSHPLKPNQGKLALKSAFDLAYYFTGGPAGTYHRVGGAVFRYTVEITGAYSIETLTAQGPITENIIVELLDVEHSTPKVDYTYHLPTQGSTSDESHGAEHNPIDLNLSTPGNEDDAVYMWKYTPFSPCSVSCGTGLQTAHARCRDAQYPDREIPDDFCLARDLPMLLPIQQKCNTNACPPRWVIGAWGECSQMCGGGVQTRPIQCRQVVEHSKTDKLEDEALCSSVPKPEDQRECNIEPCPYTWSIGEWSDCPVTCGNGTQTRSVVCIETATGSETHPSHCDYLIQPEESRLCQMRPCLCYWSTPWKKCNNSCGFGIQARRVRCRYLDTNGRANDSCCEGLPLPELTRSCWDTRGKRCRVDWNATEFRECKGDCCNATDQMKERTVQCVAVYNEQLIVLPKEACNETTKPEATAPCRRTDCPQWSAGQFGECSTTCGEGRRTREVTCVQNGDIVPDDECKLCVPRALSDSLVCVNPTCPPVTTEPPTVCTGDEVGYEGICRDFLSLQECTEYIGNVCCGTCARLRAQASSEGSTS